MILHTHIANIPCQVKLEYHAPLSGSLVEEPVCEHFTIEKVMNVHGRESLWLGRKMTEQDEDRIIDQAFDALRGDRS